MEQGPGEMGGETRKDTDGDDEEKQGEGPRRSMRTPLMSANVMRVFMA